ncbi:ferric reductase like transmembrane component-domain-containing protein [Chaetomium fimeti]|uniref:Ferric reductase like transmembrane component-domain-containing protein n=1 Tax=Chaetomium fimeti TaxID=1854472 RepID=A0AAE0HPV3_9PEZI|nr:ferric reductase like transmembrane component-domain-containing protein [Chaetomium fimeti]
MRSHLLLGLLLGVLPWTAVALIGAGGQRMFYPACAYACLRALDPFMLDCSSHDGAGGGHSHGSTGMTSPECRSGNKPYLSTLAWCMHTRCTDDSVPAWELEKFWGEQATQDPTVAPKWDYGATVANISQPPTEVADPEEMLESTALAPEVPWKTQYNTMTTMEYEETMHARYGIIILVVGFGIPIFFTGLRHLPYMSALLDRINPYLVYPSTWGTLQVQPLPYLLGNAPTIGQALYVAVLLVLNVVLSAVSYRSMQPNAWYATQYQEILAWIMYRTGNLGFALFPLVMLLAGRNNVLLWLTDWSHATYVLLHRWVARIFALQVLLHSIVALVLYKDTGAYPAEEKQLYWIWGAVATVAVSVMVLVSGLPLRRWSYEIFLILHILLAVFVVVGCWYHVELRFERMFGYEMWIYATCAVWFFDRLIRVLRVLKAGIRRARVTEIGDGFVRVDIEGVRWGTTPGQHAYVYFPTLNPLRPWENHPFSLLPSSILSPTTTTTTTTPPTAATTASSDDDPEKSAPKPTTTTTTTPHPHTPPTAAAATPAGITFIIRKSTGLTRLLKSHTSLPALLDGPYPNNPTTGIQRCDRVLLIAGGIGITGLLPWARAHPNARLCWSVRATAAALAEALGPALEGVPAGEREVRVGRRFDVRGLVAEEVAAGWRRIGGVVVELEVDAYSW